jgi:hypothetical protein
VATSKPNVVNPNPASATSIGTVSFTGNGLDYTSITAWLQRIGQIKAFNQLFVPNASLSSNAAQPTVSFTSNGNLTSAAHSTDRVAHYLGTGQ